MTGRRHYAFNGDADGLCALQELRLAEPKTATLTTGVKRDIGLLARVPASGGDEIIVLDVSLDVNRAALLGALEAGASVRYFDHHYAGTVPEHPRFEPHLDPDPTVCTSILVDRYLGGRQRAWAIAGAFGDGLVAEAKELALAAELDSDAVVTLEELGVCLNYNAYGETLADLHARPEELAHEMLGFENPLEFARSSVTYHRVRLGFQSDMERARGLEPTRRAPGSLVFVLPDAAWARRASGTLANELLRSHAGSAIALLTPKHDGAYGVSVRVPRGAPLGADGFCRGFATGGGRRSAAGINHLPSSMLEQFATEFERQFAAEPV